jgi:dihydrofolate reductase
MGKLIVFNNVSLDGYFADRKGDMSWAHSGNEDKEFNTFVAENASGGG